MHSKSLLNSNTEGIRRDGFIVDENGYNTSKGAEPSKFGGVYADQQAVYDSLGAQVLENAWAGFNCCLFAYGQTGSGKSYSVVGYGENRGIVPLACEEIFRRKAAQESDEPPVEGSPAFPQLEQGAEHQRPRGPGEGRRPIQGDALQQQGRQRPPGQRRRMALMTHAVANASRQASRWRTPFDGARLMAWIFRP